MGKTPYSSLKMVKNVELLEKMIIDYKIQGSRVDEVLFQQVMKVTQELKTYESK